MLPQTLFAVWAVGLRPWGFCGDEGTEDEVAGFGYTNAGLVTPTLVWVCFRKGKLPCPLDSVLVVIHETPLQAELYKTRSHGAESHIIASRGEMFKPSMRNALL